MGVHPDHVQHDARLLHDSAQEVLKHVARLWGFGVNLESVDQWGDIVSELGGKCANVTTVLASSAVDPHDYEPTPADIDEIVLVGGSPPHSRSRRSDFTIHQKCATARTATAYTSR